MFQRLLRGVSIATQYRSTRKLLTPILQQGSETTEVGPLIITTALTILRQIAYTSFAARKLSQKHMLP